MEKENIIDDDYWLDYANKVVEDSIETLNNSVGNFQGFINWLWGLYTSAYTIGVCAETFTHALEVPVWTVVLLGIPIFTLMIARCCCEWAQLSVYAEFNPGIPLEIKWAYESVVKRKNRLFNCTLFFTFLSAVSLAAGLSSWFYLSNQKIPETIKESPIIASYITEHQDSLAVSGIFSDTALITVRAKMNDKILYEKAYLIKNKEFECFIKLPQTDLKADTIQLLVSKWTENKIDTVYIRQYVRCSARSEADCATSWRGLSPLLRLPASRTSHISVFDKIPHGCFASLGTSSSPRHVSKRGKCGWQTDKTKLLKQVT